MKTKILVTDANSIKALAIVRSLGSKYEVFTAGTDKIALSAFSKFSKKYIRYDRRTKDFVNDILEICKTNKLNLLITPEEESSFLVAREKNRFDENGITITVPDICVMKACMSKPITLEYANQVNVPIPKTEFISSINEAFNAAEKIGYPVVVRPVSSHYWTGDDFVRTGAVGYARNPQELEIRIKGQNPSMPMPFLQEYVEGSGVSVLCAMNKNADICAVAAHEGIREYRPTGGTLVVRKSIAIEDTLYSYCSKLLKKIGYNNGVLEVEFRINKSTKKVYLMEINPRFWLTVQGPINAGVDFPQILVNNVLGQDFPKPDYKIGIVTRWWLGDMIRFIRVLKGKPKGYEGYFPSRWKGVIDFFGKQSENTRNEVLRYDDIKPAIMELPCMLSKHFRK